MLVNIKLPHLILRTIKAINLSRVEMHRAIRSEVEHIVKAFAQGVTKIVTVLVEYHVHTLR